MWISDLEAAYLMWIDWKIIIRINLATSQKNIRIAAENIVSALKTIIAIVTNKVFIVNM